jgi:hypothetical protein
LVGRSAVGRIDPGVIQVHAQRLGHRTLVTKRDISEVDHVPVTGVDGRADAETRVHGYAGCDAAVEFEIPRNPGGIRSTVAAAAGIGDIAGSGNRGQ